MEFGSEEWCSRYCAGVKSRLSVVIFVMVSCISFQKDCNFEHNHQICSRVPHSEPHLQERDVVDDDVGVKFAQLNVCMVPACQ